MFVFFGESGVLCFLTYFNFLVLLPTILYGTLLLDVVNEDNDQKNDENQNKKSFLKGKETLTFDFQSFCPLFFIKFIFFTK